MASLLLVGCGKMGGALLRGWLEKGIAAEPIAVVEPDPSALGALRRDDRVRGFGRADDLAPDFRPAAVVVAVKPQVMDEILPPYRRFAEAGSVVLSIAAGRTIASLQARLGREAAVVRAMPNTPAAIGRGMTVACPGEAVAQPQRALCQDLLAAVGEVAWIEDDSLMDAVTAVSGSGPAYVFLLAECLARAGEEAGLAPELAVRLARTTVAGSGELLRRSPASPAELREAVTSPGGTTAAALDVLMAPEGLPSLLARAVAAAAARSRALAG
jgi:pyrroline-5-carboxylate reductase